MKIYIDWDMREVYKEEELPELIDSMTEDGMIGDFEDFLTTNYYLEEIFNFTETEKVEVKAKYENYQIDRVKQILEANKYTTIEINSENKIDIK